MTAKTKDFTQDEIVSMIISGTPVKEETSA
jgi:hypothetical protein